MNKARPLFQTKTVSKEYIFGHPTNLHAKRKIKGISISKAASASGISTMFYWEIENGRKSCSPEVAARIEEALHG